MPRRKPISNKQRKEQLKHKRAIKRGDLEPTQPHDSEDSKGKGKGKGSAHRPVQGAGSEQSARSIAATQSSRRLQSSFVKLPKAFLDETKRLSAALPLQRPIPPAVAVWRDITSEAGHDATARVAQLTCPKRPKWRYEMSKKEVEANEEGLFKKWIDQTDALVHAWIASPASDATTAHSSDAKSGPSPSQAEPTQMPRAPTSFERNLEVWRQLSVRSFSRSSVHCRATLD